MGMSDPGSRPQVQPPSDAAAPTPQLNCLQLSEAQPLCEVKALWENSQWIFTQEPRG